MKTPSPTGTIVLEADNPMYVLRLLDNRFWQVAESTAGRLEVKVPPGLYTARCETGGEAARRVIRVAAEQTVTERFHGKDLPRLESSAPVSGAVNNHEYYKDHVSGLSNAETADAVWPPQSPALAKARLIVMNRRLEEGSKAMVSLKGFRLLSQGGEAVTDFVRRMPKGLAKKKQGEWQNQEARRSNEDKDVGRDSFSINLPPGGYLLAWPDPYGPKGQTVCVPLWLPAGKPVPWVACAFLGVSSGEGCPAPGSLSFHLGRRNSAAPNRAVFDPGDRDRRDRPADSVATATELALASLRTGRRQLSSEMLQSLLLDKYSNPMSGILGACMLCQRSEPDWKLFDEVMGNLHRLVPDHPDLPGLEALAKSRGWRSKPDAHPPLNFPPMLQPCLTALAAMDWQAARQPRIASGSLAELATLSTYSTGLWTTFTLPSAVQEKPNALPKKKPSTAPKASTPMASMGVGEHVGGTRVIPVFGPMFEVGDSGAPHASAALPSSFTDVVHGQINAKVKDCQDSLEKHLKIWRAFTKGTGSGQPIGKPSPGSTGTGKTKGKAKPGVGSTGTGKTKGNAPPRPGSTGTGKTQAKGKATPRTGSTSAGQVRRSMTATSLLQLRQAGFTRATAEKLIGQVIPGR